MYMQSSFIMSTNGPDDESEGVFEFGRIQERAIMVGQKIMLNEDDTGRFACMACALTVLSRHRLLCMHASLSGSCETRCRWVAGLRHFARYLISRHNLGPPATDHLCYITDNETVRSRMKFPLRACSM